MCIPLAREPVLCNRKLAYHCSVAHCLVCEWRLVKLNFTLTAACSVWTLMLNFSYKSSTLIAVFRTVAGSCVISMSSFLSVTRCSVIIIYSVTHTHARASKHLYVCMYDFVLLCILILVSTYGVLSRQLARMNHFICIVFQWKIHASRSRGLLTWIWLWSLVVWPIQILL